MWSDHVEYFGGQATGDAHLVLLFEVFDGDGHGPSIYGVRRHAGGPKPLPALHFKDFLWYKARPFLANRLFFCSWSLTPHIRRYLSRGALRGPEPDPVRLRHGAYGGLT